MNLRRRLKRYNRVDSGSPGNSLTNKVEPEHPALAKVGEQEISPVEILHRIVQMQNWSVIQDALDSWILTAALEQNAITSGSKTDCSQAQMCTSGLNHIINQKKTSLKCANWKSKKRS